MKVVCFVVYKPRKDQKVRLTIVSCTSRHGIQNVAADTFVSLYPGSKEDFLWIPSRSSYVNHLKPVSAVLEGTFGTISALIQNQP